MADKDNAPQEKGKGGMKWVVIGLVVVLLLAAAGAAGWYFLLREKPMTPEMKAQAQAQAAVQANQPGPMITIKTFVVNILDESGPRYLKAALALECDNDLMAQEVEARRPQIQDAILLLISNKTYEELRDLQGKLQLRAELLRRLNDLLPNHSGIKNIYFTDFVVQ